MLLPRNNRYILPIMVRQELMRYLTTNFQFIVEVSQTIVRNSKS